MPDWMIRVRRLTIAAFAGAAAIVAVARASADQLAMPQTVERGAPVAVTYRFDQPATGRGFLDVVWTDVDGREVVRRHIPLALAGASQVVFHLDMRRAVTVENRLAVHLSLDGVDPGGAPVRRRDDRTLSFVASPPDDGWRDYQIIMWQGQTPAGYDALKRLGVTAGVVEANHRSEQDTYAAAELAPLLEHDLRFYLENIATDFYSPYHRWSGDRPVNWRFLAAEALHRQKPGDIAAFMRDPSLSDPAWLAEIRARVTRDVQALRGYRPLYYSLGDETGIADLSSFWDFDFSPPSLAAMRIWLKHRYGGLSALNREWGSRFQRWPDVMPPTTDQAVAQSGQNFAAWADFKEWMDVAFAGALADGTAAVHAADPRALSAIEGAQVPGWGGYDYSRLARSVDVIEPYDHGDNIETLRSLNPRLVLLTTLFVSGAQATYRVWHELLEGTRGLILWDDNHEFAAPDGRIGARGQQAAPYFGEISRRARRVADQRPAAHRSGCRPLFAGEHAGRMAARPPGAKPAANRWGSGVAALWRYRPRRVRQFRADPRASGGAAGFCRRGAGGQGRTAPPRLSAADAAPLACPVAARGRGDPRLCRTRRHRRCRWRAGSVRRARAPGGKADAVRRLFNPGRRLGGGCGFWRGAGALS